MGKRPYRYTSFGQSVRCAWKGLTWAIGTQRNLRLQLVMAVLALGLGIWVHLDAVRLTLLLITIMVVLTMEMLNTALEALVDSLYPEFNSAAAHVKDVAAGAALVAAVGSLGVGVSLFWGMWDKSLPEQVVQGGMVALIGAFLYLAFPKRGAHER